MFFYYKNKSGNLYLKNEAPIYKNAIDLNRYTLESKSNGIKYKVKMRYPADEILQFYNNEMIKLGYISYCEKHCKDIDRKWINIIEIDNNMYLQLFASWANRAKTIRANLILKYYRNQSKDNSHYKELYSSDDIQELDGLNVDFHVGPFYSLPPSSELMSQIDALFNENNLYRPDSSR